MMKPSGLNIRLFLVTLGMIGALFAAALHLSDIDTDIINYLPQKDPVLADAALIFKHHPMQGEMVIDLEVATPDPDRLVQCGQLVQQRMQASGLFKQVGTDAMQALIPGLLRHVADSLPVLFTAEELNTHIEPLISPQAIRRQLAALQNQLLGMDTIGQTEFITRDPLAFRNILMARLADLAPAGEIEIHKGQLLSADHKHLLITATPAAAGTDTAFAGRLARFMETLSEDPALASVTLTPMGAYRAALDNERIARRDVQKAVVLSTLGIALLLVMAFARPLIGLFAFLPAAAGTVTAFFVLALWHESISILALGFGGAIISITVDHGIAYLLFLDQSRTTSGKAAAREVWAIGLMAVLTTVGAFSALNLTGFPILAQLGQFAAIGIAASFLFVHLVFPRIFPQMPPARPRVLPFRRLVAKLPVAGKFTALTALAFMGGMLFFAKPTFNADLSSMNTLSRETAAAQDLMTRVWGGGIFNKVFVMNEADSLGELQQKGDRLLSRLSEDLRAGRLGAGFLPSMLFPGPERRRENFEAWTAFWHPQRVAQVRRALGEATRLGFTARAFAPFLEMLTAKQPPQADNAVPEQFYPLMGIVAHPQGGWMQFAALTPGPNYAARDLYARYGTLARVFDPTFFSQELGQLLFVTFIKMLAVIGISVALLIFFFFLDLKLTAITLSPVLFALVGTLGTLHLAGHPLDIPALMLGIIVIGMGIDYALFLVRAYQRYGGINDPAYERIKMTVIMAAGSTLIGFGVLCSADHALLYSAGITSVLGISYALIGAFTLLPPLLRQHFAKSEINASALQDPNRRILGRYRHLEVHPRLFARFKLKKDALFSELPLYLGSRPLHTVLDIGCGFGVPGCWVLEHFGAARIHAIDPDPERTRVAAFVFGERGSVDCAGAPNLPAAPQAADAALLLDMIHFLDDAEFGLTLRRLHAALDRSALLIIRAVVPPPDGRTSLHWKLDALRMKFNAIRAYHRPVDAIAAMLAQSGFRVRQTALSGGNPELAWVIASREDGAFQI
ncbi:MAG: methyltransferase domain-containing protein [Desulfobacteraceae bacterium]|nr:MAG: methyltransferase domain-containing protein [Desulfobacteraceae bacterium]